MPPPDRLLLSPQRAGRLSYELRRGRGPELARRRGVIGLSLFSIASIGLVALYQSGVLRRLPDVPGRWFDAEDVAAVPDAYRAGLGDAFLGLGSYAATAALAAAGERHRAVSHPWLPLALLAKVTADATVALNLTRYQWRRSRAFCIWCLLTTAATLASLPLAVPEAVAAIQQLRPGSRLRDRRPERSRARQRHVGTWGAAPARHR
jgi:uncharacterized membrane protein